MCARPETVHPGHYGSNLAVMVAFGDLGRVNGKIRYGRARLLTSQPTPRRRLWGSRRRAVPTADPRRFPLTIPVNRGAAFAAGACLLLVALFPSTRAAGLPAALLLGGAWISLVLAMTLPSTM